MNLYTADLMVDERMRDREREFAASRLAALARAPRDPEHAATSVRERIRRATERFRVMRRGTAH